MDAVMWALSSRMKRDSIRYRILHFVVCVVNLARFRSSVFVLEEPIERKNTLKRGKLSGQNLDKGLEDGQYHRNSQALERNI